MTHALHQPDRSLDVDLTGDVGSPLALETADKNLDSLNCKAIPKLNKMQAGAWMNAAIGAECAVAPPRDRPGASGPRHACDMRSSTGCFPVPGGGSRLLAIDPRAAAVWKGIP
jgi:hypothetical protein